MLLPPTDGAAATTTTTTTTTPAPADQASDFDDELPPAVRYAADLAFALAPLASSGRLEAPPTPAAAAALAGAAGRGAANGAGDSLREFCRRHASMLGADAETLEQMLEHVAQGKRKDWRAGGAIGGARAVAAAAAPAPKRKMEQPLQRFVEARPAEPSRVS